MPIIEKDILRGLHNSNGPKTTILGGKKVMETTDEVFCLYRIYMHTQRYTHTYTDYFFLNVAEEPWLFLALMKLRITLKQQLVSLLFLSTFETSDKFLIIETS